MSTALGVERTFDEARNREFHEVFAGAPQPVTGGAERGQHILRQQFLDDFVQGAVVVNQELPLVEVVRLLLLGVTPQLDAGATVYLRHAELQELIAQCRRFTCGEDHAGIGYCQAENGHQSREIGIRHEVRSPRCSMEASLMRGKEMVGSHVVAGLQMVGVTHQRHHLETPVVESEEGANAHIMSCLLRPVERSEAILVVGLLSRRWYCL